MWEGKISRPTFWQIFFFPNAKPNPKCQHEKDLKHFQGATIIKTVLLNYNYYK